MFKSNLLSGMSLCSAEAIVDKITDRNSGFLSKLEDPSDVDDMADVLQGAAAMYLVLCDRKQRRRED